MSRVKLTEAQVEALRYLAKGPAIHGVHAGTAKALCRQGLIEGYEQWITDTFVWKDGVRHRQPESHSCVVEWTITEAGRSYLSSLKDTTDGR